MKIPCAAFLIAIAGLCTGVAGAMPVHAASLWDIYQLALKNDPAFLQAQANYEAALENKPIARAGYLPDLSLNASKSRTYSSGTSSNQAGGSAGRSPAFGSSAKSSAPRDTQYGLQLTQPIFDWALWENIEQADASVAQAQAVFLAAQQSLIVDTATAYFAVVTARDTLAADHAATEADARLLAQAKAGFRVGTARSTDVEQARAAFDQAIAIEIGAQQQVIAAQESLRVITGEPVGALQKPPVNMPLRRPDPDNPAHWVEQASRANPNLKAAQAGAEIAARGVGIEQAGHLPTLDLAASYDRDHASGSVADTSDTDERQATLDLNVPLFVGGSVNARVTQAQRALDAAKDQVQFVSRQTVQQTRTAYLGVLTGISQVQALRQSVASNQTALKATQIGLQVGNKTLTDVLLAVQNLETAQTAFAQARANYLTSVLTLEQAAGTVDARDLQAISALLTAPAPAMNTTTPTLPASAATTPVIAPAAVSSARSGRR